MYLKNIQMYIPMENIVIISTKILKVCLQSKLKFDYLSLNISMQKSSLTYINNRHCTKTDFSNISETGYKSCPITIQVKYLSSY